MGHNLLASITHVNVGDVVVILVLLVIFWLDYAQGWLTQMTGMMPRRATDVSLGLSPSIRGSSSSSSSSSSGRWVGEGGRAGEEEEDGEVEEEIQIKILLLRLCSKKKGSKKEVAEEEDGDKRRSPHYIRYISPPVPPAPPVPPPAPTAGFTGADQHTATITQRKRRMRPRPVRIEVWDQDEEEDDDDGGRKEAGKGERQSSSSSSSSKGNTYPEGIDGVIIRASIDTIASLPAFLDRLQRKILPPPSSSPSSSSSSSITTSSLAWMVHLYNNGHQQQPQEEEVRERRKGMIGKDAAALAAAWKVTRVVLPCPPPSSSSSSPSSSSSSSSSSLHLMVSDILIDHACSLSPSSSSTTSLAVQSLHREVEEEPKEEGREGGLGAAQSDLLTLGLAFHPSSPSVPSSLPLLHRAAFLRQARLFGHLVRAFPSCLLLTEPYSLRTPLHCLCLPWEGGREGGRGAMVALALERGLEALWMMDREGRTPLELETEPSILSMLQQAASQF
ncbi:Hypothetical protein NocV09_05400110, partial [Nannochloropsis oceanica]